jgi:hypothetical protein
LLSSTTCGRIEETKYDHYTARILSIKEIRGQSTITGSSTQILIVSTRTNMNKPEVTFAEYHTSQKRNSGDVKLKNTRLFHNILH